MPPGGVVPGATVQVVNEDTKVQFETVTNGSGTFVVPGLIVGTFTVHSGR